MPSDIRRAIGIARLAEAGGFSRLGICDSPILYHEVYPVVAACLAATESIRIGPNVTNPVTRHWTIHAASMRANDRLAPGRAMLGIGAGDGAVHTLGLRPADGPTLETSGQGDQAGGARMRRDPRLRRWPEAGASRRPRR